MWWLARCGLILQVLHTIAVVHCSERWGDACPPGCICHTTTYADLPMKRWLREGTTLIGTQEAAPPQHVNEAVYTDEESINHDDMNEPLKMAMCIIQKENDVMPMFASLPQDVQVLTILQSRGSGDIYLEAAHMQSLELVALDIQGFHQDSHNNTPMPATTRNQGNVGQIIVRSDTFQSLSSLQYLNLQHVKILGNPNLGNRPAPVMQIAESMKLFSNNIPIGPWSREDTILQNNQLPNNIPNQLVLLQPVLNNANEEIIPYKVYKEEQERAGMSVFSTLSNLLFLRVHDCGLKEVNWEMFTGLNKLQYLSLEKNNLLFIPDFTFYGTTNLKTLSLAHNKLLGLHSTGLAGLLDLENLDLSYNNFSHLSELSLPPFPKLQKADFRGNPIQEVFASTFEIMNATKALYLGSENSEISIQTNSFLGLDSLVKFNLKNVNIPTLERDLLRGMPKLQQLKMQGSIKSLSFDAFLEMPKLETLVVKSCSIESVSMDAFYGLYGLLHLDLSHNRITSLPPGVFDQQFSLKELYLENNLLTELPLNIFGNIPAKVIRLTGNPWECTCAMRDWKPAAINGRKQHAQELCQFQYDKGSSCSQLTEQYVYDRTMAPRCATPAKYKNMSVFTALRKQLQCNTEKHAKFHRKEYLKKKHEEYEESLKSEVPSYNKNYHSHQTEPHRNKKIMESNLNQPTYTNVSTNVSVDTILMDSTAAENLTNIQPPRELANLNNSETRVAAQGNMALDSKAISESKSGAKDSKSDIHDTTTTTTTTNPVLQKSQHVLTNGTMSEQYAPSTFMKSTGIRSGAQLGHQDNEQQVHQAKLEKRQRLHEKYERTKKNEKIKSEPTYVVYNNKKPIKVSKKAWKLELAKTRQAKLKQAHTKKG